MGILEKAIGLAGVAAGGVAVAKGIIGSGKKKQLAELDTKFAKTTSRYQAIKRKLEEKIDRGDPIAAKKLEKLERKYFVQKAEYENQRKLLLPNKTKAEVARETKEFEQNLEIEKTKTLHELEMEKTKTLYGLELEKDKSYHGWDLEDAKTMHTLELEKDKSHHEWELEKAQNLHNMEMEKIELVSKVGLPLPAYGADTNTIDNTVVCQSCNHKNSKKSKFCGECGALLHMKRFCTSCGAAIDANAKFCSLCGEPTDGT